jgi:hypothetical protein
MARLYIKDIFDYSRMTSRLVMCESISPHPCNLEFGLMSERKAVKEEYRLP